MKKQIEELKKLVKKTGRHATLVTPLPPSGSPRCYYRIQTSEGKHFMGVYHPDSRENRAHYLFTRHFQEKGLPVPQIHAHSEDYHYFILDDLGDTTLLQYLEKNREQLSGEEIEKLFQRVIDDLLRFQMEGIKGLKPEYAYPLAEFNRRSVLWDLNYFKYFFIKTNEISFDENLLENDFQAFADVLMQPARDFFHYRDFQSRNIMMKEDAFWYIDFQGGRRGPLPYDLISLLYQAKAQLTEEQREHLYHYYLEHLAHLQPNAVSEFEKYYSDFLFFRLMQVLGAYGFRGLFQRKPHFLESIYPAISTLEQQLDKRHRTIETPELLSVFNRIISIKEKFHAPLFPKEKLRVEINSFSYKKTGIPYDMSPNGGGFVFDCRALPNPGRIPQLRDFTGKDKPVIAYFSQFNEISMFKTNTFNLVEQSIANYLSRHFTRLQINFGCTGGKHRSVYMAEALKHHLEKRENLTIVVKHLEQEK